MDTTRTIQLSGYFTLETVNLIVPNKVEHTWEYNLFHLENEYGYLGQGLIIIPMTGIDDTQYIFLYRVIEILPDSKFTRIS